MLPLLYDISRTEDPEFEVLDRSEMFAVAGAEGHVVFRGRCGNQRIAGPETVRERIFLNINRRPMANIIGKRERSESEIAQKLLCAIVLHLISGTLQQFQIGLDGNESLFLLLNQGCRPAIAPLDPYEDIGVKDHDSAPPEDGPFPHRRIGLIRAC